MIPFCRVEWQETLPIAACCGCCLVATLCLILWDSVDCQAPLFMGFPRFGLQFPSSGDLPHPGIKSVSPALAGEFFTAEPLGNPMISCRSSLIS